MPEDLGDLWDRSAVADHLGSQTVSEQVGSATTAAAYRRPDKRVTNNVADRRWAGETHARCPHSPPGPSQNLKKIRFIRLPRGHD